MKFTADDLNTIMTCLTLGQEIPASITTQPGAVEAIDTIRTQLANRPDGSMIEPLLEFPDDRYDELIRASYKAWGAPASIKNPEEWLTNGN